MTSAVLKSNAVIIDLTQGPVGRQLFKMTGSILIGFVAAAAFNVTDTFFVSKLGTSQLAAMGYIMPVTMVIFGLTIGLAQGANSTIARAVGSGKIDLVHQITLSAIVLGLIFVGIATVIGLLTIRPLFTMLGADQQTLPLIVQYMQIWYVGTLFLVIPVIGNNILRATGEMILPSVNMTIAMGLNIALDPILIFGLGPAPALGIKGAAIATVVCRGISLLLAIAFLRRKHILHLQTIPLSRMIQQWHEILMTGIPVTAVHIMLPIAMGGVIWIAGWFGTEAVAAISAGVRLEHTAVIPIIAMGAASLPFAGQNWGSGKVDRVRDAHIFLSKMCLLWGAFCILVFIIFARPIAALFTCEPSVLRSLLIYMHIMPFVFGFRGLNHVACSLMNAIRRPFYAAVVTFARFFIFFLPMGLFGAHFFGFKGFLLCLVIADIIIGMIATFWIRRLYLKGVRKLFFTELDS